MRVAAVCRHWLRHAPDPVFLCSFRKLHPPRLLSLYVNNGIEQKPAFLPVPTPQPPELTAVIRRASFGLDTYYYMSARIRIMDCWGGNVFVSLRKYDGGTGSTFAVHNPLCARRGMAIFPPLP